MQSIKRIGILFFVYCIPFCSYGQIIQHSFQNFTEKDGLSDNRIYNFYHDSRGYLWICTNEGLNRFDGYGFKKFYSNTKKTHSLPSNIVSQVIEYKPGYLLVMTSNGIVKFNILTNEFEPLADSISKGYATYMHKEESGDFIFCFNDGVAFLDSNLHMTSYLKSPYPGIIQIHRLRSGELLALTSKAYCIIDKVNMKMRPLEINFGDVLFPRALIFSFYDSLYDALYLSDWYNGIFIIDLANKKAKSFESLNACNNCETRNIFYSAYRDQQHKLWMGSNNGIFLLDSANVIISRIKYQPEDDHSLVNNGVMKIYEDGSKNIWFGTVEGISRLNQKAQKIRHYKKEFLVNKKSAFINDITRGSEKDLYISTYGNGIFRMKENTTEVENIGKNLMPFNWSVVPEGNAIIATGHDKMMYSYQPDSKKVNHFDFLSPFYGKSNLLLFSFTHSSGDKWYSLNEGGGLVLYSRKDKKYIHYTNIDTPAPFTERYFSRVEEDESGNIWFTVNRSQNIVCWNYKSKKFKTIPLRRPGKFNNFAGISDFLIDKDEIWLATTGTGIILYNAHTDSISTFSINEGLAGDVVNSLIMDNKKRVWAGTAKGLSCRLPGQKYFTSFSTSDGLPEINFNERARYYDPVKNKLYLGAQNSLLVINPDDLLQNQDVRIHAYLDGIKVNGENINYTENESSFFKHDQNSLQFNFSLIDLSSSSGINLLYQLEGADKDWINAEGQRTASYINLPPGNYRLRLKISKPGTDFSSSTVPFSFTIGQAWWKTTWFFVLLAAVAIAVLYLVIRMYYRGKLEHQQMVFEKKQAVEEERTRIATDMHDDLGAGLTGIKFLSENISEDDISTGVKERLEKLKGSANKLIESMGEIIWAMNEKNNTVEDLLFHLRSYSITYCEENMLTCGFNLPENVKDQVISGHLRRNVFLIVKECLHNIVKHANAKNIDITISIKKDFIFEIHDNGRGFTPGEPSAGNGLINMQKRAKEMKGSLTIINSNGTLVQLKIPLTG